MRTLLPAFTLTLALAGPATAGTFHVLHDFAGGTDGANPVALILDHGTIAGTTEDGGGNTCPGLPGTCGTVFTYGTATGTYAVLHAFRSTEGYLPNVVAAANGTYYVATLFGGSNRFGNVVAVDPASGNVTQLHSFTAVPDGAQAVPGIFVAGQTLYGLTAYGGAAVCPVAPAREGCGTAYKIDLPTGAESVLYRTRRTADGFAFNSGVLNGKVLYGTASYDANATKTGSLGNGLLFSVNTSNGARRTLYRFKGANDGGQGAFVQLVQNGIAYGVGGLFAGAGVLWSYDTAKNTETVLHPFGGTDGSGPIALVSAGPKHPGVFYGATVGGGKGYGTLFSFDVMTRRLTTLYAFTGGPDGLGPQSLVVSDGAIYGVAAQGGTSNNGTLFSYVP